VTVPSRRPRALVGVGLAGALGCASTRAVDSREEMCFHASVVATLPSTAPDTPKSPDDLDLTLTLRPEELTHAVAERLRNGYFSDCTELEYPSDRDPSGLDNDFWIAEATRNRSDLLVRCEVNFVPRVQAEKNGQFLLNLPLFLLGGPFTYWVEDITYRVDVYAQTRIYDIDPRGQASQIVPVSSRCTEIPLNFTHRARGVGVYALSLVCPAGFLAIDNDKVSDSLESGVTASLADAIVKEIQTQAEQIERYPARVPFYFDGPTVRVVRTKDDALSFDGDVILRGGGGVDRLSSFSAQCGEAKRVEQRVDNNERTQDDRLKTSDDERVYRYHFHEEVPVDPKSRTVRVTVFGAMDVGRSYTFPISSPNS
jgi:hypothetical protein